MKRHVAIIFGGKSPEHEVSVISARNICNAIDKDHFEALLIGISTDGMWYLETPEAHQQKDFVIGKDGVALALIPGAANPLIRLDTYEALPHLDAVFPTTHGPNGEDGSLQGILKHLNLAYVGPDVLGSAVAMDKDVCKRLFKEAGIGCADGIVLYRHEKYDIDYQNIIDNLSIPLFVKPCNMGSSIGVSKAENELQLKEAIDEAFKYDVKILVEKAVVGRELECAVLGNEHPQASGVGEVSVSQGFYDFETKYVNDDAQLDIPAHNISEEDLQRIRATAIHAYRVLGLEGLTRVDVFLTPDQHVVVNEVNTLPGFTNISMYPKLWENSGIAYTQLITKLLDLAIARSQRTHSLKTNRL
jgi:D-alanine-D-alanine ligase